MNNTEAGDTETSSTEKEIVKENIDRKPKNIVLMIGDGMGLSQITAGYYRNKQDLNLALFKHLGLIAVHSADNLITDSAAGATAFATGKKTYNGAVSVDQDTLPLRTIIEEAIARGKRTGLVATCALTHATPAAFAAHQRDRYMSEEIALDLSKAGLNLMIGGGQKSFETRSDARNLMEEMSASGYRIYPVSEDVPGEDSSLYLVNFVAQEHPESISEGRSKKYLTNALHLAMDKLQNEEGYFLMVEGSQIDWGGHANDMEYIIEELLDFDRAVGLAYSIAEKDAETLVIVTADHETGGFAINAGVKSGEFEGAFTSAGHTASLIPVFAFGPGAENFQGLYDNTDIYNKMKQLLLGLD
jgi:alkaline phosphatase